MRLPSLLLLSLLVCALLASSVAAASSEATLDLSGTRILSVSPQLDGILIVRWTAPTASVLHNDSSSAALLYTLLAETSSSQQSSISVCESAELHCHIDAGTLPAGESMLLRLMVQSDRHSASHSQRHSRTFLSAPFKLVLARVKATRTSRAAIRRSPASSKRTRSNTGRPKRLTRSIQKEQQPAVLPSSLTSGDVLAVDPAQAAAALCRFWNVTGGVDQDSTGSWCTFTPDRCDSIDGLACDHAGNIVGLEATIGTGAAVWGSDLNFLWRSVPLLQSLSLECSFCTSTQGFAPFNLTSLGHLKALQLLSLATPSEVLVSQASGLLSVDLSNSAVWFDLRRTPLLQSIVASANLASINLADIWMLPQLTHLELAGAPGLSVSIPALTLDGEWLSGSNLTHWILGHLYRTNPQLQTLILNNTPLPFGPGDGHTNFPVIHPAPGLLTFDLSQADVFCSAVTGPPADILVHMPDLHQLSMTDLMLCPFDTQHFARIWNLTQLDVSSTLLLGSLETLHSLSQLNYLNVTTTGLSGALSVIHASLLARARRTPFRPLWFFVRRLTSVCLLVHLMCVPVQQTWQRCGLH